MNELEAEIRSCIRNIIRTIPGSDPLRPAFGCSAYRYLDRPENGPNADLIYAIRTALERWEPRFEWKDCKVMVGGGAIHDSLHLQIEGVIRNTGVPVEVRV